MKLSYDEVMKLSPDELRLMCAELEGWKIEEREHGLSKPRHLICFDGESRGVLDNEKTLADVLKNYPDSVFLYDRDPRDYMRLMEKIWEKESLIWITKSGVVFIGESYEESMSGRKIKVGEQKSIADKSLGIAIMRAFIHICQEEK